MISLFPRLARLLPRPDRSSAPGEEEAPVTIIQRRSGWQLCDPAEIWRYRELLGFLALRDIKVRYKQTVLGAAWAIIQPFMTMVVFTIFFGRLAGLDQRTGGIPYPLFAFAALLPWQLFSYALTHSSNSLVAEQKLLTKVYFPRLFLPLAPLLSGLADFAIALAIFLAMMASYGVFPGWSVLLLPAFVALTILTSLSVGLWLSALNALYRDVRYTIPFLTQVWLFLTPIAYPAAIVPPQWQAVYGLNPMVGVVEGFRWALLGAEPPSWPMLLVSLLTVLALLISGLLYFRRMENYFADVV
jgi:lipopolysaccharide transport system permease protein